MVELNVYDSNLKSVGKIAVKDEIFSAEVNEALLHEDVIHYLAERRSGNACSKNRSEVKGGGSKPWKQKGTGRARHGNRNSPLWVGGGTVFGPKPRSYGYSFPKKKKWGAVKSALSDKVNEESIVIVDSLEVAAPRTKELVKILDGLKLKGKKVLFLVDEISTNLELSARNMKKVSVMRPMQVRSYNVLHADTVVFTKETIENFQRQLV